MHAIVNVQSSSLRVAQKWTQCRPVHVSPVAVISSGSLPAGVVALLLPASKFHVHDAYLGSAMAGKRDRGSSSRKMGNGYVIMGVVSVCLKKAIALVGGRSYTAIVNKEDGFARFNGPCSMV
uniref:Dirigent protein n=1 Tax=Panagrellus redivivus TaxID=6233 RepID=A0A7E5A2C8_PANRE